jgi:hypothetical protein
VKDIGRITPILELGRRSWLVLSDSDRAAREQQRLYDREGPWLRYDELVDRPNIVTSEDFLKVDAFRPVLKEIESETPGLPPPPFERLTGEEPKLEIVRVWLEKGGIKGDGLKETMERVKRKLFEDLRPLHIEDCYFDVLQALTQHVNRLPSDATVKTSKTRSNV